MGLTSFVLTLNSQAQQSAPTVPLPVNTVLPSIVYNGLTVTVTPGTWTGATTLLYQWKRDGVNISGATNTVYTLTDADGGTEITVIETAVNSSGSVPATSTGVDIPNVLVMSEEYLNLTGAQLLLDSGTSSSQTDQLYVPRMLYHAGKTYYAYMMYDAVLPHGQLRVFVFDKDRGFDVPVTFGDVMIPHVSGPGDTHTLPSIILANDPGDSITKMYAIQERTHLTPFDFYKDVNADYSRFTFPGQIGLNLAYGHIIEKTDGDILIWCRGGLLSGDANHLYSIFVVDSTNYFEGLDTATPRQITQKEAQGLWHYPGLPFGYYKENGWYHFLIFRRTGQADGGTLPTPITNEASHKFYKVKTQDFITYYNHTETFSHDTSVSLLTGAQLQANCMYHETNANDIQGRQPTAGVSSDGKFYGIQGAANGDGSYVFIYYDELGTVIKKAISISNLLTQTADDTGNAFSYLMPFNDNDIRVVGYRTLGGFDRPHLFKTTNKGDSWIDLGDMCPEVNDRSLRALMVNNAMQIPVETNFPIYFSYADGASPGYRGLICKLAAWNDIQAIPGVPVTPAGSMNYNSTGLFHYRCDNTGLTKTGNNVTALIDQFGIRNAACANNPQWNGSNAVTFLSASSQKATPATPASLVNKTALTLMAVVKFNAVSSHLLTFTNTGNALGFISMRLAVANLFATHPATVAMSFDKDTGIDTVTVYGHDDIDDSGIHLVTIEIDGRAVTKLGIDGKDQFFQAVGADTLTEWQCVGKGPAHITGTAIPNTVSIAARDRSTDDYTNLELYEMVLWNGVMPTVERRAREKKLCDDYGITYQNQFQIPS